VYPKIPNQTSRKKKKIISPKMLIYFLLFTFHLTPPSTAKKKKKNLETLKVGCQIQPANSSPNGQTKRVRSKADAYTHTLKLYDRFHQIVTASSTFFSLYSLVFVFQADLISDAWIGHHVALSLALHRSLFSPALQVSSLMIHHFLPS
jgi:hypothetical protein